MAENIDKKKKKMLLSPDLPYQDSTKCRHSARFWAFPASAHPGLGGRSPQGDQSSFPYGRTHVLAWWTGGASAVPQALHLLTQALQAVESSWCHLRGHQRHSAWPRPQHGSHAGPQHGGQAGPHCCQVNRFCRAKGRTPWSSDWV